MTDGDEINRRDFIVTTATIAGSASALAGTTLTTAQAQTLPPPGFDAQEPFAKYWGKELHEVVNVESAEHAESRMVRRLFSLTDIFDSWKTGDRIGDRSRAFSLQNVTLYTSLESCAQCSGVMSLGGVKQVVYLQNDFTAYMIGNIMFNLANRISGSGLPGAPTPIPASEVGLQQFKALNDANLAFVKDVQDAKNRNDLTRSFFVSPDKTFVDYDPSITSFLCTDAAREIFEEGGKQLDRMILRFPNAKHPDEREVLTNQECLEEARSFFNYADVEGYRGSPHKL
jgi:hypothetical protein